jgi:drug/metabolite transporter (DMT)-like permease
LLALAAVWGGSFLFMRIAAPQFGPAMLVEVRLAIAAAMLAPLVVAVGNGRVLLARWAFLMAVGVLNSAVPFVLLAYATLHVTGGFASILNATTPFFAAIVAYAWLHVRLLRPRVVGLVVGFGGVILLVWGRVSFKDGASGWAIVAALGAACCYGISASFIKRHAGKLDSRTLSAGSLFWGAVALLPLAIATMPGRMPSPLAWGHAIALGVLSTALAYLMYFRLLASLGPTGAVTVTFLVPAFAMLWGGIFLHEAVTGRMAAGAVVILVGTALTTGLIDPARALRRTPVASRAPQT